MPVICSYSLRKVCSRIAFLSWHSHTTSTRQPIDDYRAQNDWFGNFLDERCEVSNSYRESSNALYQAYRNYCVDTNEYVRSTADFYTALEGAGFDRIKIKNKRFIKGVRLKPDDAGSEDFLN